MNHLLKRSLSLIMAVLMVLALIPANPVHVHAEEASTVAEATVGFHFADGAPVYDYASISKTSKCTINDADVAIQVGGYATFKIGDGTRKQLLADNNKVTVKVGYLPESEDNFIFCYTDSQGKAKKLSNADVQYKKTESGYMVNVYELTNAGFNGTIVTSGEAFGLQQTGEENASILFVEITVGHCVHSWKSTDCATVAKKCDKCGVNEVALSGHNLVFKDTQDSTCAKVGWYAHNKCSACSKYFDADENPTTVEELTIPVKDHTIVWGKDETQHQKKCTACGVTATKEDHKFEWVRKETQHYKKCSDCGYTTTAEDHTIAWNKDETQHQKKCTVCGVTATTEDHKLEWVRTENQHYKKCSDCGYTTTAEDHTIAWDKDETQHQKKCTVCGATASKEDHKPSTDWQTNSTYHGKVCTECGAVLEKAEHTYDKNAEVKGTCTVCQYVCEHKGGYTVEEKAPTCTEPGTETKTCNVCGKSETKNVEPELDHDIVPVKDGDADTHRQYCQRCQQYGERAAHEWVAGETVAPSVGEQGYTKYSCKCGATKQGDFTDALSPVAKIDETGYATLQAAIDAAAENDTITLVADIELTESVVIPAGETVVLDLNGKTVTMVTEDLAQYCLILNKGNLTITDSTVMRSATSGKLSYHYTGNDQSDAHNTIETAPGSVLTVEGGIIENLSENCLIAYAIDGLTNGNGGDVTVNINGGNITSKKIAVRIFANSTTNTGYLNISGGEIFGRVILQSANASANKAALNITGGTFNTNGYKTDVLYVGGTSGATADFTASVSGGTFEGEVLSTINEGFISGGTFTEEIPVDYCVGEYLPTQDENGNYVVKAWYDETATTLYINNKAELLAFAAKANEGVTFSGKTIVLNADIDLGGATWTPIVKFSGTFDGQDNTISNFYIDATSTRVGFFQALSWATVRNFTLADVTATVGNRFGTLVYSIDQTTIENVNVKNVEVTTTNANALVAGLACAGTVNSDKYLNNCTVEDLTVNAERGALLIGGIITFVQKNGTEADGTNVFKNLHVKNFKVVVNSNNDCGVGGLVSQTQSVWQNPHFKDCSVTGLDVTATGKVNVGGFMAYPGSWTYATNCTVEGKIDVTGVTSDKNYAGGFFGNYGWGDNVGKGNHKVTDCSANVDITTKVATAGGFVGSGINTENKNKNITLTNCEAQGAVTSVEGGTATIGGFAGNTDRGEYINCTARGEVTNNGTGTAGQFIGKVMDHSSVDFEIVLDNCDYTGSSNAPFLGSVAENTNVTNKGTFTVIVGGIYYTDLASAMAAAQNGDTITLIADIELTESVVIPAGKTITLDLNGKIVSTHIAEKLTKSFCMIQNKGTLTITDSVGTGKISVSYDGESFGYGVGLYAISNEGGVLTIAGGTVENLATVTGSMYDAIDNNSTLGETVLNITGGTVSCPSYIAIRQFANSTGAKNIVNVEGGTITGGNTSVWMQNPGSSNPLGELNITNGTVNGRLLLGSSSEFDAAVSGGTFDTDVSEFCAEDYKVKQNDNDTYSVIEMCLEGSGTAEAPYLISSVEDFIFFAKQVQSGNSYSGKIVKLANDIDFNGANFLEIAEDGTIVTDYRLSNFSGTFDGDNYTIKNFNFEVKCAYKGYIMMFSSNGGYEIIRNLKIENVTVNVADITGQTRITALANLLNVGGKACAAVENVHIKNYTINCTNTTSSDLRIGGFAYFAQGSQLVAENCSIEDFTVNANSATILGGAVSIVKSKCDFINVDVIDAKFNIGNMTNVAGGFAGQTQDNGTGTTFTNCDVDVEMTFGTIATDIGGFVASIGAASQFDNCTTSGSITVTGEANGKSIGGFVGDLGWNGMGAPNTQHEFNNCVADVDITAVNANVGGFIGNSTVEGYPERFIPAYFNNCEAKGNVKTVNGVAGGFVGRGDRGIFTNCSASGNAEGRIAGGFWGELYPKAKAESTGGWSYQGKEVTHTDANAKSIVLDSVAATGAVKGTEYEAGIIGFMKDVYVNADETLGYATPIVLNETPADYNRYEYPAKKYEVSTKAELNAALAEAQEGEIILLTADIDYGTDQLKIEKAITLDLGGKTLTTRNAWGGMIVTNNPTIKNGTIVHASNTAAIKVWNATAFEDLIIDVQGKGDANKTIGGIVLQSGSTTNVGSIKNVTIQGEALTNGIETYNCGDAAENVIGSLENVTIDAKGTGMLISAPVGTATNCSISGDVNGVEIWIKGNYNATLTLVDSSVEGGVYAHDEFSTNPTVVNNGTLKLTVDETTTGAQAEDITLTLARAENVEGELKEVKDNAQATVNNTFYATIQSAITAAQDGDTVVILPGEYGGFNVSNKNINIAGTVGENGELLTTIKGANTAITGHRFNGTIKDLKFVDVFKVMYAESAGNVTVDNVHVAGATYGFHLVAYTDDITWTIQNSYMDLSWANSFGVSGNGDAKIIVKGNRFESTNPYYPEYGALAVNTFLPNVTVEENIFGENVRIYIDNSVDTSEINISKNYHADGVANAFADDADGVKVAISEYYNSVDANGNLTDLVICTVKIGTTCYVTLADAIAAAQAGDTVTLLADNAENVTIDKNLTLDLAGYAYTGTISLASGAELTAPASLNVVPAAEHCDVVYAGGVYSVKVYVAQNVQTGKYYTSVNAGLLEAVSGQTVIMWADDSNAMTFIMEGVTLDLNGYSFTSTHVVVFNGGNIVDNSASNAGRLVVDSKRFMIEQNAQLPVNTAEGYMFVDVTFSWGWSENDYYIALVKAEPTAHELLKADLAAAGVSVYFHVSWTNSNGLERSQDFECGQTLFAQYLDNYKPETGKYGKQLELKLTGVAEGMRLTYQVVVKSNTGAEFTSGAYSHIHD